MKYHFKETYAQARSRLHRELKALGWTVSDPSLKVLWAKDADGETIRFKIQAVYLNQHSLWLDIRGMSVTALLSAVNANLSNSRE